MRGIESVAGGRPLRGRSSFGSLVENFEDAKHILYSGCQTSMMILGITGALGAGKTTVARLFSKHGFLHINADSIGHRLLNEQSTKKKLVHVFGTGIISGKKINRAKLRIAAFSPNKNLKKLNSILHPRIFSEIKSLIKNAKCRNIIIDAALLVEADAASIVDKVIVVTAPKAEREKRMIKGRKWTIQEISTIAKSQFSQGKKLGFADFVVDNSGTLEKTKQQVDRIVAQIARMAP